MSFLQDIFAGINRDMEKTSRKMARDDRFSPEKRAEYEAKVDDLRYRREEYERKKREGN